MKAAALEDASSDEAPTAAKIQRAVELEDAFSDKASMTAKV